MRAVPDGDLLVPTEAAADAFDAVGDDGFAVTGATEDDASVVVACGYGLGDWANEVGVIAGCGGVGSEVFDGVALGFEVGDDRLLVNVARVVGADRNGEFAHGARCVGAGLGGFNSIFPVSMKRRFGLRNRREAFAGFTCLVAFALNFNFEVFACCVVDFNGTLLGNFN